MRRFTRSGAHERRTHAKTPKCGLGRATPSAGQSDRWFRGCVKMSTSGRLSAEEPMASVKVSAAAALSIATLLGSGCAPFSRRDTARRRIIATYSLWDGMGPPSSDPQFSKWACVGTFTISNLDVTFAAGTSPGCATPMHQRTAGTLAYSDLREI